MTRRNRARCRKCGDIIESRYRHDFVTCKCEAVSVDGGRDYFRRCGRAQDIEELNDDGTPLSVILDDRGEAA